jgi:carboxypeptidase PM20D1
MAKKKMKKWVAVVLSIVAVLVVLVAIIAIKTATFTSKQVAAGKQPTFAIDADKAAERLSGALKFKTISNIDYEKFDYSQFTGLQEYIEKSFPLVHSTLEKKVINDYALLYIWKGSDPSLKPILLLGHQDVVPVAPEGWQHEPFSGDIAGGYIWGRGTLDDKGCIFNIMEAAEYLIKDGFKPARSIYFAFGHDEEIGGMQGAKKIGEYLKSQDLQFEFAIDEGMLITKGSVPGVKQPAALIGTAEKGYLSLELIADGTGGHASMPPKQTAVGVLAAAVDKLEMNPFPIRMTGPASGLFEYLGPEMSFPYNMLFANMWLFGPVVQSQLAASNATNATIRTSTAPTMFQGSSQDNVLPTKAVAVVNFRILPGESVKSTQDRVVQVVNDPRVKVQPMDRGSSEPSPISPTDTWSYRTLNKTIREVMPDVLIAPMLVLAGTDCEHYEALCPNIYRFLPQRLYGDDTGMIHGTNEKIAISNYVEGISYYIQLMKNMCGSS